MVYIGLVSTINGFEQTINLRIKVNLFCGQKRTRLCGPCIAAIAGD